MNQPQRRVEEVLIACLVADVHRAVHLLNYWKSTGRPLPERFMLLRDTNCWKIGARIGQLQADVAVSSTHATVSLDPGELFAHATIQVAEQLGCKVPPVRLVETGA